MRRTHLRRHENILKRLLIHASGFNLGLVMRHLFGVGKPRRLQGAVSAALAVVMCLWHVIAGLWAPTRARFGAFRHPRTAAYS